MKQTNRVCPVERAGSLDNRLRRLIQNPEKIVAPYLREGMTVMDLGCGPGFFTLEMAKMVGSGGKVIASDLQLGMLERLHEKIKGTPLEQRIILHHCTEDTIGVAEKIDFVLAFYMFHEIAHQEKYLVEVRSLLKPHGRMLIVEPPIHVSRTEFANILEKGRKAGFAVIDRPKVFLSKSALLGKGKR